MKKSSRGRTTSRKAGSYYNPSLHVAKPVFGYENRYQAYRYPVRIPKPYSPSFKKFPTPTYSFRDLNPIRKLRQAIRLQVQNLPGIKDFICAKRKIRSEVLHAFRLTTSGKGGTKNFTSQSKIKC